MAANQEIPAPPMSFLNSPHSTERHSEDRMMAKVQLQAQVEGQGVDAEDEQPATAVLTIPGAEHRSVAEADVPRMESFKDVQVEVVEKSEKMQQYFGLSLNGSGEGATQEQSMALKKQRKACGFKTRFSDYTKNVLEHAYEFNSEGSPGKKHLEPGIVKKLSDKCGISHEQVKQWVRNRNKKVRRRCHLSETELNLRGEIENAESSYQYGRIREDSLRPSFTLNQ